LADPQLSVENILPEYQLSLYKAVPLTSK